MMPWEMGKQWVCNVEVLGLKQCSLVNPGNTENDAESPTLEMYQGLLENGDIFQSLALEAQGSTG